jgi:hypothetical protein
VRAAAVRCTQIKAADIHVTYRGGKVTPDSPEAACGVVTALTEHGRLWLLSAVEVSPDNPALVAILPEGAIALSAENAREVGIGAAEYGLRVIEGVWQ